MPASIGVNLRVTGHCRQGGRKYMEDYFTVAYQQTDDEKDLEYAFFGIYDGHGGAEAAIFAKEHLMETIIRNKNFWSEDDDEVLQAIKEGYVSTHYAMWREQEKWPKTASGLPSTAGTTASVAFIRKGKIYIGHVGDSGIILGYQDPECADWKARALTKDHKPENDDEMSRIQACGGKVVAKSGVPRVVWNRPRIGHKGPVRRSTPIDEIPFLAVARSLGDLWSYNSQLNQFVVSPDPDCSVIKIDPNIHRCLIFGTDGLYNMLNPHMAVHIVQKAEKHNEQAAMADYNSTWLNPSKLLVERALQRWHSTKMRADNTSVITLMLDPPGPPRAQVLRDRRQRYAQCPPGQEYPERGLRIVTRYEDESTEDCGDSLNSLNNDSVEEIGQDAVKCLLESTSESAPSPLNTTISESDTDTYSESSYSADSDSENCIQNFESYQNKNTKIPSDNNDSRSFILTPSSGTSSKCDSFQSGESPINCHKVGVTVAVVEAPHGGQCGADGGYTLSENSPVTSSDSNLSSTLPLKERNFLVGKSSRDSTSFDPRVSPDISLDKENQNQSTNNQNLDNTIQIHEISSSSNDEDPNLNCAEEPASKHNLRSSTKLHLQPKKDDNQMLSTNQSKDNNNTNKNDNHNKDGSGHNNNNNSNNKSSNNKGSNATKNINNNSVELKNKSNININNFGNNNDSGKNDDATVGSHQSHSKRKCPAIEEIISPRKSVRLDIKKEIVGRKSLFMEEKPKANQKQPLSPPPKLSLAQKILKSKKLLLKKKDVLNKKKMSKSKLKLVLDSVRVKVQKKAAPSVQTKQVEVEKVQKVDEITPKTKREFRELQVVIRRHVQEPIKTKRVVAGKLSQHFQRKSQRSSMVAVRASRRGTTVTTMQKKTATSQGAVAKVVRPPAPPAVEDKTKNNNNVQIPRHSDRILHSAVKSTTYASSSPKKSKSTLSTEVDAKNTIDSEMQQPSKKKKTLRKQIQQKTASLRRHVVNKNK